MHFFENLKYKKTASFLAGMLSSLAFAPVFAWPLFLLSLCFVLELNEKASSYKKTLAIGYWYGFGLFAAGFYWISNALLVDAESFGFLYPVALLASGAFFGLYTVPPFVVWHIFQKENIWIKILAFSGVFVLFEYIRAFFLTGFPWNMLGTMLAFNLEMVQISSIVGAYGLSLAVLILACSFYAFVKGFYKSGLLVFTVLLLVLFSFGFYRLNQTLYIPSNTKVRLVQPSIPQNLKWDPLYVEQNLETYIEMSRDEGFESVDFVIWGEVATAFNPKYSEYYMERIRKAVPKNGYLITGILRYDEKENKAYNSMSVIDKKGQTKAFYDKSHLVPFGEYIPFRKYLPNFIRPVANVVEDFSQGEKYKLLEVKGFPKFGALICYEIIFPHEVINEKQKPDWLVLVSNDGWYGESFGPYQHLVAAQMRAVEEGITIVRSANTGISAVVDPFGRIIQKANLNQKTAIDVYLPRDLSIMTIYNRFGNIPVLILIFGTLLALTFFKIKKQV